MRNCGPGSDFHARNAGSNDANVFDEAKRTLNSLQAYALTGEEAYYADSLRRVRNMASWDPNGGTSFVTERMDRSARFMTFVLALGYGYELAGIASALTGERFALLRAGKLRRLERLIRLTRFLLEGQAPPARGSEPTADMRGIFSPGYFDTIGIRLIAGRNFTADEDRAPNAPRVVMLADGFWRRRFAADSAVLGRTLVIGGHLNVPLSRNGLTASLTPTLGLEYAF